MRSVWGTYYRSTDAVILMVDSTDRARIALAKVSSCGEQGWSTKRSRHAATSGLLSCSLIFTGRRCSLGHPLTLCITSSLPAVRRLCRVGVSPSPRGFRSPRAWR
jgi:hypothetical protein